MLMSISAIGFTTVLHYCTMSHSFECCCPAEHQNQSESSTKSTVGDEEVSCNVQIVVGGLTPVALNASSEVSAKSVALDLPDSDSGIFSFPVVPHIPLLVHASDIAPPKVDIYIRGGALLI
jgi:hypothetical protein